MSARMPKRTSPSSAGGTVDSHGPIRSLRTGVPGFDAVLGGGLPEYSFNLVAGAPGGGKTTLVQQIVYANATAARPALYFTVLGEPTLKMLRYQRQFSFFDPEKVGTAVQYINLSAEALERDLGAVLDRIVREVGQARPGLVVVDSFRTFVGDSFEMRDAGGMSIDSFVQRLALHLTSWETTSFLIGEYADREQRAPVFTVADGVFWVSQVIDRNSVVRKLQVVKVRGRAQMPGLHTFRITDDGVQIFPRIPEQQGERRQQAPRRLASGIPGLDAILGGGIPAGDAVMLAGPTGSGKTTFATQFAAEGLRQAEPVVIVVFEEYPDEYLARADARSPDMETAIMEGRLELIYLRPLDLSVDETLAEILEAVERIGAVRVVIDSLSGFEVALAPAFREDFRESLYRLVGALTATGATIFMTVEVVGGYPDIRFTTEKVSFITDDIIVQRMVEMDGELRKVLSIVKMRGSDHSTEFMTYEVSASGARIGGPLKQYHGILTGIPELRPDARRPSKPGLTAAEHAVFDELVRFGDVALEELAGRCALPVDELAVVLARIVSLGYAVESTEGDRTFHAVDATA